MTIVNGLPAHVLLVHAIVVLLPLTSLLLVLSAVWPKVRRPLAGPNALLSLVVLAMVPVTTNAGEWLGHRVQRTELIHDHAKLGDTAIWFAIPVAVMAVLVWWRGRRASASVQRSRLTAVSTIANVMIAVLSVSAASAAVYGIYRIGDSGARASWEAKFSPTPIVRHHR
jgi:hypothetical protein